MANDEGFIKQKDYHAKHQNFYRPINIDKSLPTSVAPPTANLATQSGIQVRGVEKFDIDVNVGKINDTNESTMEKVNSHFNVLSGKTFNPNNLNTYTDYNSMIKDLKLDKTGIFSDSEVDLKDVTMFSTFGMLGTAASGDYKFGTLLKGPTKANVFSAGKISEIALNNHFDNYGAVQDIYTSMNENIGAGKTYKSSSDYMKSNDTGFFAVIGGNHFSRKPNATRYEGHLGHLHSDSHTAFNMAKSIDALSKGLDPRGISSGKSINLTGYSLTGGNEDNIGMSDAMLANGMGGISNDGYYTYVSGSALGHTKSKLYGGNLSNELAKELGKKGYTIDGTTLSNLMTQARKSGVSFTKLLSAYKTSKQIAPAGTSYVDTSTIAGINRASGFTTNLTTASPNLESMSSVGNVDPMGRGDVKHAYGIGVVDPSQLAREQDIRDQDKKDRLEKQYKAAKEKTKVEGFTGEYGFNTGGQVSSPVGQLANMLRSNRLGYNQGGAVQSGYYGYQEGGQINMQEMGFVNGKTPDQVTDAQSVADTEAMSADEGDFVINAPAVEAVGVEAIIGLVSDALTLATEEGVEIVDIPQDTSPEVMVDILVSEGEFIVPRELIPFIEGGIETLEKINALGTDEVSQRVDETAMMEQDIAAEEGLPPEELPAEEMMMETPDQVPAPPTFNTGGIVTLDFNYNRGFI